MREKDYAVHLNPVWRGRANFIINAEIEDLDYRPLRFEQLWAHRISESCFEVCCIPFFVYDLALGDRVEARPHDHVVSRVVERSGHYTFQAWFGDADHPDSRDDVLTAIEDLGCEFEWYSRNLLGIDARDDELAQDVADYLSDQQSRQALTYETGRTG